LIGLDTNILVHAHRGDSSFHPAARSCLRGYAEGSEPWALFASSIHEFLAVVTNPRIWRTPSPMAAALAEVAAWRSSPKVVVLAEDEGYWDVLERLLTSSRVQGARVHDARIAAMAIFHGVEELLTADRDFSRFPELKTRNPL
jgi:toxin-antitoxin system PIN domain toxin